MKKTLLIFLFTFTISYTNTIPAKIESKKVYLTQAEPTKTIEDTSKAESIKEKDTKKDKKDNSEITVAEGNSLFDTVKQGGSMMIPVIILALIALTLIIERMIFYYRNKYWNKTTLKALLNDITENSTAKFQEELEDELRDATKIHVNKMESGLAILSGTGNLAPLVGFLGTVVGMIKAFASIAAATTVNAKVVAVGIQIALVTTAGGLSVAVPALAFYHLFIHYIQRTEADADEIIVDLTKKLPKMSGE